MISQGANAVLAYSHRLPSQPRSSPAVLLFLNVLCFVNSTMVYFLWGICIMTTTAVCLKANSEDVIFWDLMCLNFHWDRKGVVVQHRILLYIFIHLYSLQLLSAGIADNLSSSFFSFWSNCVYATSAVVAKQTSSSIVHPDLELHVNV